MDCVRMVSTILTDIPFRLSAFGTSKTPTLDIENRLLGSSLKIGLVGSGFEMCKPPPQSINWFERIRYGAEQTSWREGEGISWDNTKATQRAKAEPFGGTSFMCSHTSTRELQCIYSEKRTITVDDNHQLENNSILAGKDGIRVNDLVIWPASRTSRTAQE